MNIKQELEKEGRKRVILDTDTYNEIDDQFALSLAMVSEDKIDLSCVTAAPFHNSRSSSFADGMERSYREIGICSSLVSKSHGVNVPPYYMGSRERMPDPDTPVESEAAHKIAGHVMEHEGITYITAIGAITNVASSLLLHPEIKKRVAVIWLGGHARWYNGAEFNLMGDKNAANSLFKSGVPMLLFPCMGVVSHLSLTIYELEHFLRGNSPLGDYLCDNVAECEPSGAVSWSRVIWDISTICGIIEPNSFSEKIIPRPRVNDDYSYSFDESGCIEHVESVNRDLMFSTLFSRLRK